MPYVPLVKEKKSYWCINIYLMHISDCKRDKETTAIYEYSLNNSYNNSLNETSGAFAKLEWSHKARAKIVTNIHFCLIHIKPRKDRITLSLPKVISNDSRGIRFIILLLCIIWRYARLQIFESRNQTRWCLRWHIPLCCPTQGLVTKTELLMSAAL